jgi:hypothetical protein
MSAAAEFVFDEPTEVGELLDDFIRYRNCRPSQARALRASHELPWVLGGYVHPSDHHSVWRAWTQNGRTYLMLARIAADDSRAPAGPVLSVSSFDFDGQPFPTSLWRRLPDGSWLECDRSPPAAARLKS